MKRFKRLIIVTALLASMVGYGNGSEPTSALVSENYTVKPGDTLWSISQQYITKNTYGARDIREFYQGIIEINDPVFQNRIPGEIHPGDKLTINYFVKD
ncbi:MAG: Peptidoglycan-binding lysin protein [Sporomusa sp.]|jgi:nucleoid-associated protein YgaU|nr:Peptidoglycan-binding lysin protein [Sporomusa sp.]